MPDAKFNLAKRIDTRLVDPLAQLPPGSFGQQSPPADPLVANLAFRNLERASMMRLATGQGMVKKLQNKGVAVTALTDAQIRNGSGGASIADLTNAEEATFLDRTPLWFYILREAELNGGKLAGVGARIVAETHPPRDRGQPHVDPPRHGLQAEVRARRHHVRHARPPLLRLRGQEEPARAAGLRPSRERARATRPEGRVASGLTADPR